MQTASDPSIRYDAVPDDDGGLHLEFCKRHVLKVAMALRTCQRVPAEHAFKRHADAESVGEAYSPTTYTCMDLAVQPLAWMVWSPLMDSYSRLVSLTVKVHTVYCTSCGPLLMRCK